MCCRAVVHMWWIDNLLRLSKQHGDANMCYKPGHLCVCVCVVVVVVVVANLCVQMYDDVCTMGMMGFGWCGVSAFNHSTPNAAVGP